MPDVFTHAKRSEVMSRIRSRGNKDTELALIRVFRSEGITGWRRHLRIRVGSRALRVEGRKRAGDRRASLVPRFIVRPDFVFPSLKLAVFVDGCFWHACPVHATKPRSNAAFWRKKLAANRARDQLVTRILRRAGWRVLRLWEHALRRVGRGNPDARLVGRLQRALSG